MGPKTYDFLVSIMSDVACKRNAQYTVYSIDDGRILNALIRLKFVKNLMRDGKGYTFQLTKIGESYLNKMYNEGNKLSYSNHKYI